MVISLQPYVGARQNAVEANWIYFLCKRKLHTSLGILRDKIQFLTKMDQGAKDMLILSRNKDEEIRVRVGDTTFYISVTDVSRAGRVRLSFDAPPEVEILRYELADERE